MAKTAKTMNNNDHSSLIELVRQSNCHYEFAHLCDRCQRNCVLRQATDRCWCNFVVKDIV
jgi:hypothetical protein